jgi:hypothetical protein
MIQRILLFFFVSTLFIQVNAQTGSISNVQVQQRSDGSGQVDVNFDLNGPATPSQMTTHTFQIPQGWSGISTPIIPLDLNVETLFQSILSDLIILQNETGVYWPGQNVNTIGDWNTLEGYKIKVANDVELTISGSTIANKTLQLSAGWNLIPVFSDCNADVAALFAEKDLIIVKQVAGSNVYWPEFGINSLGSLESGKAYFVLMGSDAEITFPECNSGSAPPPPPSNHGLTGNVVADPGNSPFFRNGSANEDLRTAISHTIAIPAGVATTFLEGDIIGAVNEGGDCFGLAVWQNESTAITLFGNDPTTAAKDGFDENEPLLFKLYRPETDEEFLLEVSFDQSMPNPVPIFTTNGLSAINGIKLSGIRVSSKIDETQIQILPNPAKDEFLLVLPDGEFKDCTMKIYTIEGQIVNINRVNNKESIINISNLSQGVYILKVEIGKEIFTKRLVKD